jgi:hypothetical protein
LAGDRTICARRSSACDSGMARGRRAGLGRTATAVMETL